MGTVELSPMPGPRVAVGERVTLRTTEREDVPFLSRQNNSDLRLPTGNPVSNQASLASWVEDDFGDLTWLTVCLDDGAVPGPADADDVRRIGAVGVEDHGRSRPELSYWLIPEYQGEGYGTEAVALSIDIAFQQYHHPGLEAKTFPDTEASRGLLESLGFTQEGRIRNAMYWDGRYRDLILYGLLRDEWDARD